MNEQSRESLDAYYAEAASWNRDRQEALRNSRRAAWWVATGASVIAVAEALALILLTPLKTVVPYTLLVDRNTGFVQALKPLDPDKVAPDAALTQSFLVQYVIARESFDMDMMNESYRKVGLWSAEQARSDYLNGVQISNPQSPMAIYPRTTVIETRVKSVSPVGRNVALVRFDTIRRDAGGQVQLPRPWVAVIRYRFSGEPMKLEDRFLNPLGFQVVRYRRDAEAVVPEAATAPAPATILVPGAAAPPLTVVAPGQATTTTTVTTAPSPLGAATAAAARAAAERRRPRPEPQL
ncbi:MAG: type secretion system protein VirB8 [Sphingomonadales bacterium]|jgi:type IV secretion system protein VirB8|nr:type secretion system protein VirB8 [Sphingomonadales bacterium]